MAYIYSPYEKQIWDALMPVIQNEYGVAGLMGNLNAESIISPGRIQDDLTQQMLPSHAYTQELNAGTISEYDFVYTKTFSYNGRTYGPAYGLAQWDWSPRRQNYWNYWHTFQHGIAGSLQFEVWFLLWELQNQYAGVFAVLQSATSVKQASDKVLHDFENPASQGPDVEQARAAMGQNLYDAYHGSSPTPTGRKLPLFFYLKYPF